MTTASSAHAAGLLDLTPVAGQWVSVTGLADGPARLRAEPDGDGLMVSARGHGEPGQDSWGQARARVFANGPDSARGHALIADFDRGQLQTRMQTYQALGLMVVHAFHRFKDRPEQAGYFTREFFVPADEPGHGAEAGTPRSVGSHDPAALTGTWHALAPAGSQRIATLECSVVSGQLRARAYGTGVSGAGGGGPADWGEAPARVYADAHYADNPPAFLTRFEHDSMRVHVEARPNRGVLVVCEYTEFTDGSGRRGYFIRECYQR